MKIITYYSSLLILLVLLTGFVMRNGAEDMSMPQMISFCLLLAIYVIGVSIIGYGKAIDERETYHRYLANRFAMTIGTIILSAGILFQLFNHQLDLWLLAGLIGINLAKIGGLIYLDHRK